MELNDFSDTKNLRLTTVQTGKGNTKGMTARQLLERRKDLEAAREPMFRIRKLPEGDLSVEPTSFDEISRILPQYMDRVLFVLRKDWETRIPREGTAKVESDPYDEQIQYFASFSKEDRVKEITEVRKTIEELRKSDVTPEGKAKTIMDAVQKTFLINKVSLRGKQSEIGIFEQTVANETKSFVSAVLNAVEESELVSSLFECFSDLSNGQTLNHVNRVFTTMIGFLQYYGRQKQQRVGQHIRLVFASDYEHIYRRMLPELTGSWMSSDNLVQLVQFTPPELKEFGLGAFLHDIGKMANLDYFESDLGYDVGQVRQHVFVSSGLIIMNYGMEHERARAMAGDHHNALFHKDGYGVTRLERERNPHPLKPVERCITADLHEYMQGRALGYLPTEMLAVVDVYDAMTDASRAYKKPMSPENALDFMYEKFVLQLKMDPLLFDIFADFLRETGVPAGSSHGLSVRLQNRQERA